MFHLDDVGPPLPRLPDDRWSVLTRLTTSGVVHASVVLAVVTLVKSTATPEVNIAPQHARAEQHEAVRHVVFLAPDPREISSGGGGGGNRLTGPVRRAEGVGSDRITLRIKKAPSAVPITTASAPSIADEFAWPSVVLEAKPLTSGMLDQIGLPLGGVLSGTSTGPGSGGGVGGGFGTGIGSGRGPGIGPGSGGGTGGDIYRPGGAVTAPRVIAEVRPTYTTDALQHMIQGTVLLELVVTREGRPSQIRVVRSLDPGGLDEQAVTAAAQWRFEPGRLAGTPVDVLVTIMLDFWIR